MIMLSSHLPTPLAGLLLVAAAAAQTASPLNPPPWWGMQDNVTVSLYWDFGNGSLAPTSVVAPTWYNPAVTGGFISGPLTVLSSVAGHQQVMGMVGNGQTQVAMLRMKVDNDPHLNWVKVFYFQYDTYESSSGEIIESLRQDLARYERSGLEWSSTPIGNGWETVTVEANIFPQPDDEEIEWSFIENGTGTLAIDNLFVSSKCVKIGSVDTTGDAMGEVEVPPVDLNATTGTAGCIAAARTEGAAPTYAQTLWLARRAVGLNLHAMLRLQGGQVVGTTFLPSTGLMAPEGPVDLAVETIETSTSHTQYVYALVDERTSTTPRVRILAAGSNGSLVSSRYVVIPSTVFPSSAVLTGLAFMPTGLGGAGTFIINSTSGVAYVVSRQGTLVGSFTNVPSFARGLGYDPTFGNYYLWSDTTETTPRGPLKVNGYEMSAYSNKRTGVRFWGDLSLQGPSLGGTALGLEAYRSVSTGQMRLLCVVDVAGTSYYYELAGPFSFGKSIAGKTGMSGQPFAGSSTYKLTLETMSTANFAVLYSGFSNTMNSNPAVTLPFPLMQYGIPESQILVDLFMSSTLLSGSNGFFSFTLPTLPTGFGGAQLFSQWLVFDPELPGGLGLSKGGRTRIY